MHRTKNTVQDLWPTRYGGLNRMRNTLRKTVPILSKRSKKGILVLRCGVIRCVGANSPAQACGGCRLHTLPYFLLHRYYNIRTNVRQYISAKSLLFLLFLIILGVKRSETDICCHLSTKQKVLSCLCAKHWPERTFYPCLTIHFTCGMSSFHARV